MVRLQCPRCGTYVESEPGSAPVCPKCGFRGEAPVEGPSAPAPPEPSTSHYSGYGGAPMGSPGAAGPTGEAAPGSGAGATPYGYGAPAPGPQWAPQAGYGAPQQTTNGMAVAALVLSLVGLCTWGLTAILGIIFGVIGLSQCRSRNQKGEGMAMAGIVVGVVVVVLGALWFFVMMAPWWYL